MYFIKQMNSLYFQAPPAMLSLSEKELWLQRLKKAESLVGIADAGIPQVSLATLDLLQRYVRGELTLEQVVRLQSQRLPSH